jgi:aldehyde:ferredoxin oxidoreductase
MNGYAGRILHVDLSAGAMKSSYPSEDFYRKYFGGSALGTYFLLSSTKTGIDPFSPENTLVFALSGLTGVPISGQSRMTATAKSPLTGAIGDSQCGGFFPAEMKFSGFDAVVITGRAERPVYLFLHDGEAEFRPADHLWGKFTYEVESAIKAELGDDKVEIAQCGPGGEKLIRYASIINMSNRANGRTGMGAIMGSKNLKAVVVRGSQRPEVADPKKLQELARWGPANFEESDVYSLGRLGTASIVGSQNAAGGLPTKNWESGAFEGWEHLDGKTMERTILKERDTCYACTVRCKRVVEVDGGPYPVDPMYGGPEYETLATLGSYCCVKDLEAVSHANQLCNMYGIDTISCGATIAWAMECFETGILSKENTDGIDLRFGNAAAMVQMVKKIGKREGFGNLLAEGSARAAAQISKEAEDLLVTVKKQEFPAHMPQVKRSLALLYAVNPFGADHMSHEHDPSYRDYPNQMADLGLTDPQPDHVLNQEKVRFALTTQYTYSFLDSANLCQFVYGPSWQLYDLTQMVALVQAVMGWDVTIDEIQRVGERRLNMLRSYNAREGIGRREDILPKKVGYALRGGASDGMFVSQEEVERAKDWYYQMAGWNVETGIPTRGKLLELGLEWIADLIGV